MSGDLDIDTILKAVSDPKAGKNIESVMEAVKEINKVLQEVQKTVDFLDKCGVKTLLVRAAGVKLGVDVDTPLQGEKQFKPASNVHAHVFNQLNTMSEADVEKMFTPPEVIDNGANLKSTGSDSS